MSSALWIVWQVAHLAGLPLMAGYFVGRWAQRSDDRREVAPLRYGYRARPGAKPDAAPPGRGSASSGSKP